MATDLGMSAPAPSTFLSSKTLPYESNPTFIFFGANIQAPRQELGTDLVTELASLDVEEIFSGCKQLV